MLGSHESQPASWDDVPTDEPTPEPEPYKAPTREIGIRFKPVPADRGVLWDAE